MWNPMNMNVRRSVARSVRVFNMQIMQLAHPRFASAKSSNSIKLSLLPACSTPGTRRYIVLPLITASQRTTVFSVRKILKSILTGCLSLSSKILLMTVCLSARLSAGCVFTGSGVRLSALVLRELALAHSKALNKSRLLSSCTGVDGVAGLEAPLFTPPGGAESRAGTSGPPQRPGAQAQRETLGVGRRQSGALAAGRVQGRAITTIGLRFRGLGFNYDTSNVVVITTTKI